MGFQATLSDARDRLRIAGDCRMADAPVLDAMLRALRETRPASVVIDLTRAGDLDIGPSWLLHRTIADLRGGGAGVELEGPPPEHFAFLDGLAAASDAPAPAAARRGPMRWLVDVGMRMEKRWHSWYEALDFGGRVLVTAVTRWTSLRRLRLPSIVRHIHETGVQAIPLVAVIAFLITVI